MDELKERFLYLSKRAKEVTSFYTKFFMVEKFEDPDMTIKALEGMSQLSGVMQIVTGVDELSKSLLDAFESVLAKHEGVMMGYAPSQEVE